LETNKKPKTVKPNTAVPIMNCNVKEETHHRIQNKLPMKGNMLSNNSYNNNVVNIYGWASNKNI
jgi:hypothetical protein